MPARRWTPEQIVEMRHRYRDGESQVALAEVFGGSPNAIKAAVVGYTYSDIPGWLTVDERRARRGPGKRVPANIGNGMWA